MNRIKYYLNYPVQIDAMSFLYIMGILTGISLGFWAGRA